MAEEAVVAVAKVEDIRRGDSWDDNDDDEGIWLIPIKADSGALLESCPSRPLRVVAMLVARR